MREKLFNILALLPGKNQAVYQQTAEDAKKAREQLDLLANQGFDNVNKNSQEMGKILSGGQGSLAAGFDDVKNGALDLYDKLKNPPPFNIKPITERLKSLQEIADDVFKAMDKDMSDFFYNSITEKSFKLQTFFQTLGQSILRIWTDLMAQMITRWLQTMTTMQSGSGGSSGMSWLGILGKVAGIFGGVSGVIQGGVGGSVVNTGAQSIAGHSFSTAWSPYHRGGIIRAHSGLAIDEIPIIAKRHEGVLSERGMYTLGGAYNLNKLNRGESAGGGDVIHNHFYIQAQDTESFLKYKPQIIAVVTEAMKKNTPYRNTSKTYGH